MVHWQELQMVQWMQAIFRNQCLVSGSCAVLAQRLSTNIKNILRKIQPWSAVSSKYTLTNPLLRTQSPYCVDCVDCVRDMRFIVVFAYLTVHLWRLLLFHITISVGAGRFLPDKAIDLVDEAVAKLKMEIASKPTALDDINRSVLKLEMERLSLTSDTDKASKDRLSRLEAELESLKKKYAELTEQWEHENQ